MRRTGPAPAILRLVADRSLGVFEYDWCLYPAVHFHHRRPRQMGSTRRADTNLPANLLHLCRSCHERIESNRAEAYESGYLLRSNADPSLSPIAIGAAGGQVAWVYLDNAGAVHDGRPDWEAA